MSFALLSVYDKTNIDVIGRFLNNKGYLLMSSGGTYKYLLNNNCHVDKIENYTNHPEMLEGRVKTLHPKIHGGLLAKSSNTEHIKEIKKHNIIKITVTIVNLYPFSDIIKNTTNEDNILEMIDIGGHTLIRSAAKNYEDNIVLTCPEDYQYFMDNYDTVVSSIKERRKLAMKAFEYIADYDMVISGYFSKDIRYRKYTKIDNFKYGCNPHQQPASYWKINDNNDVFDVLNGKPGYINYIDAVNSWFLVSEIKKETGKIASASFKHTSPAGVAINKELTEFEKQIYFVKGDTTNVFKCVYTSKKL